MEFPPRPRSFPRPHTCGSVRLIIDSHSWEDGPWTGRGVCFELEQLSIIFHVLLLSYQRLAKLRESTIPIMRWSWWTLLVRMSTRSSLHNTQWVRSYPNHNQSRILMQTLSRLSRVRPRLFHHEPEVVRGHQNYLREAHRCNGKSLVSTPWTIFCPACSSQNISILAFQSFSSGTKPIYTKSERWHSTRERSWPKHGRRHS